MSNEPKDQPGDQAEPDEAVFGPEYYFDGLNPDNPHHVAMFQYSAISRFIAAHPGLVGYRRSAYEHVLMHLSVNMWPVDMKQVLEIIGRVMELKSEEGSTAGRQLTEDELKVNDLRASRLSKDRSPRVEAPGGWVVGVNHSRLVDHLLDLYNLHRRECAAANVDPGQFNGLVGRITAAMFGTPRELVSLSDEDVARLLRHVEQALATKKKHEAKK